MTIMESLMVNPTSDSILSNQTAAQCEESMLYQGRIVAIGGGTGLSTLLQGLRLICFPPRLEARLPLEQRERLTAIVTVSDDGGSSGILRKAYPMLPPGDIRNCLLALAGDNRTQQALFGFRFNGEVDRHSLGNLIITALTQIESDFTTAVEKAGDLLGICGRVLPATTDKVSIEAEFNDGSLIRGESRIASQRRPIRRVSLIPAAVDTLPEVTKSITRADTVIIGPGSLYTSLIPVLLVPGIAQALARSRARVVLIMNLMTEPGETDGYRAADFIAALRAHVPGLRIDEVLVNDARITNEQAAIYAQGGSAPVGADDLSGLAADYRVTAADLCTSAGKIRHDPARLARTIFNLIQADRKT